MQTGGTGWRLDSRVLGSGAIFVLIVMLAYAVTIVAPPPGVGEEYCGRFERLLGDHGYVHNCDSDHFLHEFRYPLRLFRKDDVRQSRPLFILSGTAVLLAVWPLAAAAGLNRMDHLLATGILLNGVYLGAAVALSTLLLRRAGVRPDLQLVVALIIAVNDVTKAFVWTTHTQMLNLFVPIAITAAAVRVLRPPPLPRARFAGLGLVCGFSALASGFFFAALPALTITRQVSIRRAQEASPIARGFADLAVFAGAFAAPILGWAGVVTIVVGHFYSHDSEVYRQFVWMLDSLRSGGPSEWATDVGRNTLTFLRTAASWDVIPVLLVGGILLACCYSLRRVRRARRPLAELELALLIVTISVAAFLWLMGFYETRLTFAIVPTLSMLVAVQLERLRAQLRWWHGVVAAAMAVLWVGAHIVRPGPYS